MKHAFAFAAALVATSLALVASAGLQASQVVDVLTVEDGLPANAITALAQDAEEHSGSVSGHA
ncbi:MAG: hypothetical protein AAGB27_15710 [Pseudomonadota bacterium]